MEQFKVEVISNKALSAGIRGAIQTADKIENGRWNLLGNCIERAINHNDVSWLNKGREMARSFKSGMVNDYVTIARELAPFGFTFKDGWGGKIKAAKRDKMKDVWEARLNEFVNKLGEKNPADKKKNPFDLDKYLKQVMKKLATNEVDPREFASLMVKASPTVVQEVAQARENEDNRAKAEARKKAA